MNILHLIQKPQLRGAEMFTSQLAGHQKKMGHRVLIVSVFSGDGLLPWDEEIISLEGNMKMRFLDVVAWKRLSRIIVEFCPDVLQANAGDTLKYAVFSKMIFGWKTPVIFRNASEVGRYLSSGFQKNLNSFLYKRVSGIISVSQASKKDLLQHFPFLINQIWVIPVGLEDHKVASLSLKPEGYKHIVHIGGFSFEKNHKGLLRILGQVLKLRKDVHLHLIGDGVLKQEIEREVRGKNLDNHITFYGFVNNPLSYISSADVLVLPSVIEGLPGVLLEGMFCSTPVVAYDVGGISEIVSKETGELIEKNDEEGFASTVVEILREPDHEKINAARKMVEEGFMNTKIAKSFLEAYNSFV